MLLHTRNWWLKAPGADCVPIGLVQARSQGSSLVAQLDGLTDRDQAEALRSQSVLVARSEFPPTLENEFYWIDLIGCAVENSVGLPLGEYQVAIGPPLPEESFGPPQRPLPRKMQFENIPARYRKIETSPLQLEVRRGENPFNVDMMPE